MIVLNQPLLDVLIDGKAMSLYIDETVTGDYEKTGIRFISPKNGQKFLVSFERVTFHAQQNQNNNR